VKTKVLVPVTVGLLALSLIVISASMPWFKWSFQEGSQVWYERTSVWGPPPFCLPAYSSGPSYASVDVSIDGIKAVNWAASAYLVLFLLAIVLWIRLLQVLGRELERRTVPVVVGIVSVGASVGLVLILGLGELIAQRVGLFAAIRTLEIVVAEMVRIQIPGPLMLTVGVVAEAFTMVWGKRTRRV
jgi:hypothetical protein